MNDAANVVYRNIPANHDYTMVVTLAIYMTAWVFREFMWFKERDLLIDRLMSRDLKEYKAVTEPRKAAPQSFGMLDDETLAILEEKRKSAILES